MPSNIAISGPGFHFKFNRPRVGAESFSLDWCSSDPNGGSWSLGTDPAFSYLFCQSMESTGWSVFWGVALGVGYALLAYLTHRLALTFGTSQRFLVIVMGGMLLRMVLLLLVAGAMLALMPLQVLPFAAALVVALLVGLLLDLLVLRRALLPRRDDPASPPPSE